MTKPRRWMLLSVAAIVAALVVLVILFDWNWLKGPLESRVSAALGREFRIAGDLDVDLGLEPRITMQDVRIANASWASEQPMLQVQRIEAVVDLPKLVQGEIVLPEVAVTEPTALLESGPEGRANWQFLVSDEPSQGAPAIPSIGQLQINDGEVRYRDLGSGYTVQANLSQVTGTTDAADGGMRLAASGEVEQQALELGLNGPPVAQLERAEPYPISLDLQLGESDLSGELTLDLFQDSPAVQAKLASEQVRVSDLRPLLPAGGQAGSGDQAAGDGVEAALARAQSALDEASSGGTAEDGSTTWIEFGQLPAMSLDLHYTIGRVQGPDLRLQDVSLEAGLHDQLPTLSLTGGGQFQGAPVQLDVRIGPAEGEQGPGVPYAVEADIEAGATSLQASGEIRQPQQLQGVEIRFDVTSPDATELLRQLGVSVPEIPDLRASGQVVEEGEVWHLRDASAQVGESDLSGEVSVDLSSARPFISADLQSDRLRAEDLRPGAQDEQAAPADTMPDIVTASGINLDALPELDADVKFQGSDVSVPEFRFDQLQFEVRLRDRVVVVDATGQGTYQQREPLTFEVHAGTDASLEQPDARYPVDLMLRSGDTVASLEGTVDRPLDYTGLEVEVSLEGPNLNQLGDVVQLPLPETPPYQLAGQLTHREERWNLIALQGSIGDSDISGDVTLQLDAERPIIYADLRSETLDFDDLGLLIGVPPQATPGETASEEQQRQAAAAEDRPYVLPDKTFDVPQMRAVDARVQYSAASVEATKLPLEELRLELTLEDGEMTFEPLRFDLARGQLEANVHLDGRTDVIGGDIAATVRDVELTELLSRFDIKIAEIEMEQEGAGTFSGQADLQVRGNSIHDMAASADGKLLLIMDGGRISALVVEALGLDVGEVLGLLVTGDEEQQSEMVPVQCMVARFDVHQGVLETKALVLETTDSTITGSGQIDLGKESLSVELLAHPKDPSVLSASTPVRIEGTFKEPQIDLVSEELEEKSLGALALGVIMPVVGAILPFIEEGETKDTNCRRLIESAAAEMPAGSPEVTR